MSMIMEYVRLRPHELAELRRLLVEEPDGAYEYAGDLCMGDEHEAVSSRGMDTDQAWAGLRWLLNRMDPPVDIIGGGEPMTHDKWGYDSPRLLATADVADVARFLADTPFASLAEHYAAAEMVDADVYRASGLRTGRCHIWKKATRDSWPCSALRLPTTSRSRCGWRDRSRSMCRTRRTRRRNVN